MLTEALNAGQTVGQFAQYWRFFERAFKGGYSRALPCLQEFLTSGTWHGFTSDEVTKWGDARNPSIHANRAGEVILDADVLLFLGRMREAAYDVLLNKKSWWTRDAARRDVWKPAAGSLDALGGMFVTKGRAANLSAIITDPFGSFPDAMFGVWEPYLPDALWLHADANGARLTRRGSGPSLT